MNEIAPYRPRELSDRQTDFVRAFVATGDAHQSALVAGYAPATARNAGTQLLESSTVTLAIVEAARLRLARGAPLAINTLEHLMTKAQSERVRLEASKAWLDRAGLVPPAPPKEDPNMVEKPLHEMSTEELRALAAKLEGEISGRAIDVTPAPDSDVVVDLIGEAGGIPNWR
jgi:phage terminase small subunit